MELKLIGVSSSNHYSFIWCVMWISSPRGKSNNKSTNNRASCSSWVFSYLAQEVKRKKNLISHTRHILQLRALQEIKIKFALFSANTFSRRTTDRIVNQVCNSWRRCVVELAALFVRLLFRFAWSCQTSINYTCTYTCTMKICAVVSWFSIGLNPMGAGTRRERRKYCNRKVIPVLVSFFTWGFKDKISRSSYKLNLVILPQRSGI